MNIFKQALDIIQAMWYYSYRNKSSTHLFTVITKEDDMKTKYDKYAKTGTVETNFGALRCGDVFEKLLPDGRRRYSPTLYMKMKKWEDGGIYANYAVSLIQGQMSIPDDTCKVLYYPDVIIYANGVEYPVKEKEEVVEDRFVRGDKVLVKATKDGDWVERIYLTTINGAHRPFLAVNGYEDHEVRFKRGHTFDFTEWKYIKKMEKKKLDIKLTLGGKEIPFNVLSAETLEMLKKIENMI